MVITVQCPECATSFPVDPAKVPPGGVKARCSSCAAIFSVERPDEAVLSAPAPAPPVRAEPEEAPPSAEDLEVEDQLAGDASAEEPVGPSEPAGWEIQAPVSVETPEVPVAPESTDDWVFETEEDIDQASLQIDPVGTLEESLESAKDEVPSFGSDLTLEADVEIVDTEESAPLHTDFSFEEAGESRAEEARSEGVLPSSEAAEVEERYAFDMGPSPEVDAEVMEPEATEEVVEPEPVEEILAEPVSESIPRPVAGPESQSEEPAMPAAEPAPAVTGFTFGRRDPHDKARRLARVLVSDIITYNPDRHHRALSAGSLKEDFEEEIEKSWKEYVEQVGPDIARNTPYWSQALNDVLAKGQQIF
ncbi:MAG: zinc-ribbon domain-containing protein [Gemmatimonadetes bacterium]|nr:zinc-ribbon domain-containing protein [Gemmatimonadota bacterium]